MCVCDRYIEASPDWAKQLEADLPAGKTTVTFMAHSPLSHETATCSFNVEVIGESPALSSIFLLLLRLLLSLAVLPFLFFLHLNPVIFM